MKQSQRDLNGLRSSMHDDAIDRTTPPQCFQCLVSGVCSSHFFPLVTWYASLSSSLSAPLPAFLSQASKAKARAKAEHATLPSLGPLPNRTNGSPRHLTRYSHPALPAPIHETQETTPLTSSMAGSASSPFLLALAFLFALVCSLLSPTDGAELIPDQWHEFEVPVMPEDKVRVRDN